MITSIEIAWVAGLLEGEGNFSLQSTGSPRIKVGMTDLDTIEKFRRITKTTDKKITVTSKDGHKTKYDTAIFGNLAIQWMMTVYSWMGIRRKEKIKDVIEKWKTEGYCLEMSRNHDSKYEGPKYRASRNQPVRNQEAKAIKALAISKGISIEEAKKMMDELLGRIQ
jgi:hypothetical protein